MRYPMEAAKMAMAKFRMVKMSKRATEKDFPRPLVRLNSPIRRLE